MRHERVVAVAEAVAAPDGSRDDAAYARGHSPVVLRVGCDKGLEHVVLPTEHPHAVLRRRSAVNEQRKPDRPVKGRKNGLYGGVSEELDANMRSGWADTERHGLEPSEQSGYAAKRRKALSAGFPGERLIIPAGRLKPRSNDTDYAFRPSSDYTYLTGDQTENSVLVLEPQGEGGHSATLYLLPRSDRENGE